MNKKNNHLTYSHFHRALRTQVYNRSTKTRVKDWPLQSFGLVFLCSMEYILFFQFLAEPDFIQAFIYCNLIFYKKNYMFLLLFMSSVRSIKFIV